MISNKLKKLFLLSLLLIYIHGVEEILTGFAYKDSFMVFGANLFKTATENFYWVFHLIWWVAVPVLFFLFKQTKLIFLLMSIYGSVFVIEIHHLAKAVILGSYYPGMITAVFYPVLGYFYWKELIKNRKGAKQIGR